MIRLLFGLCALSACCLSAIAQEKEEFPLPVEYVDSEVVSIKSPDWIAKDYGWLMICRLVTPSDNLLEPSSYLRIQGIDENEEVVWEQRYTVLRKNFDEKYGGFDGYFMRATLKERLPLEVLKLVVEHVNERKPSPSP